MSTPSGSRARSLPASAGIFAGPFAWFVDTELNYALANWACARDFPLVPLVAAIALAVAVAGGLLSLRELRRAGVSPGPHGGVPGSLLAGVGVMTAALFATVILLHGTAGVVFSGCER